MYPGSRTARRSRPGRRRPRPETVVVREAEAVNLAPAQARSCLRHIGRELDQDSELRLSITWRLSKTRRPV